LPRGRGWDALKFFGTFYLHPHGMTHSSQILYRNQTRLEEIFYRIDAPGCGLKVFLWQILTHSLFPVANLLVFYFIMFIYFYILYFENKFKKN